MWEYNDSSRSSVIQILVTLEWNIEDIIKYYEKIVAKSVILFRIGSRSRVGEGGTKMSPLWAGVADNKHHGAHLWLSLQNNPTISENEMHQLLMLFIKNQLSMTALRKFYSNWNYWQKFLRYAEDSAMQFQWHFVNMAETIGYPQGK